ncbi:MAG: response regulator [Balneolaceae bacterium]
MNILIVEDDKVLSLMLQKMVERMGYQVAETTTEGQKAVELSRILSCDLILMDIMLEDDLDGIEAYRKINESEKIPVIYITGNSDPANKARADEMGYHDYIIKPVIYENLLKSIRALESENYK